MITEDYVSFETAILLKEKGFNEKCQRVYMHTGKCICSPNFMEGESFVDNADIEATAIYVGWITYTQGDYAYLCPTLQTAMKWLREAHKIFIEPKMSKNTFLWGYRVSISNGSTRCIHANIFNKYEEACEEAIKYCLENLI